jgi:hypothetical protein
MPEIYRERENPSVRVLLCFGVAQNFFDAPSGVRAEVVEALKAAFNDLHGRFGAKVLGTLDDDDLVVGPSSGWPWTAYILADVEDLGAVRSITTLVRDWEVGSDRLWRYIKVEARVGRPLFFGNS